MRDLQSNITNRKYVIDLQKFDNLIEKYANDMFTTFSRREIDETIEEIHEIVRKCISEREKVGNDEEEQSRIDQVVEELYRRRDDESFKTIMKWERENMAPIKLYWQTLDEVILLLRGDHS